MRVRLRFRLSESLTSTSESHCRRLSLTSTSESLTSTSESHVDVCLSRRRLSLTSTSESLTSTSESYVDVKSHVDV